MDTSTYEPFDPEAVDASGEHREVVTTLEHHWDARLLQGFLEANGVSAWVATRGAGAVPDEALVLGGHQVLVRSSQLDVARELVASGAAPPDADDAAASRLELLLMELLGMECVTGEEGPLADWLADRQLDRGEEVVRVGDSLVVGRFDDDRPTVLLVGHLDVVPATDAEHPPRVVGDRIIGRGASDMKSGLAVAIDCFEDADLRVGPYNLVLVAYAGEEGPADANELPAVLDALPELSTAELAVVLEPTDLTIQLGCLGGLHALITIHGAAAHSARPWFGENALTKAGRLLDWLHRREPEDVVVDDLVFREVLTATQAWTDNPRNVVPERFTINLNYRFSPHQLVGDAELRLRELLGDRVDIDIVDRAPPAPPARDEPLIAGFCNVVDAPVEAKQAWTDVARLVQAGVPALNFGPGLAAQAHVRGEHVPRANLASARLALARFLSTRPESAISTSERGTP